MPHCLWASTAPLQKPRMSSHTSSVMDGWTLPSSSNSRCDTGQRISGCLYCLSAQEYANNQVWGSLKGTSQFVRPSRHFNLKTPLCWDWGHPAVSLLSFFCCLPPYGNTCVCCFRRGEEALTCMFSRFSASPKKLSSFGVLASQDRWSLDSPGLGIGGMVACNYGGRIGYPLWVFLYL